MSGVAISFGYIALVWQFGILGLAGAIAHVVIMTACTRKVGGRS